VAPAANCGEIAVFPEGLRRRNRVLKHLAPDIGERAMFVHRARPFGPLAKTTTLMTLAGSEVSAPRRRSRFCKGQYDRIEYPEGSGQGRPRPA